MQIDDLQNFLKDIQKPAQYLGNEVNAVHKDFSKQKVRIALVFPDAYEMGMSHMGLKILYDILNSIEGVVAERCFAPGLDLEKKLRAHNVPLFSLESKTPLKDFDIIGISLPYELTYTNILNIIDLAQIPIFAKDRNDQHPIILAGGTQAYNPEPVADFFDVVSIGDGEEIVIDLVSKVIDWKEKNEDNISPSPSALSLQGRGKNRLELLKDLTQVEGMYIPRFFEPEYNTDGTLKSIQPLFDNYTHVKKRVVNDLDKQPYPTNIVVPNVKLIHDRIGIEIQRGCTRMCRFCQAGYIERPTRQRSPERVLEIAEKSLKQTGIDEISLLSLSAGDYQTIVPTLKELNKRYKDKNVSISVPATRTETLTPEMIEQIKQVRMSGFTIAPEAGSERMRRVINKGNKVEDLMQACENAFSAGYKLIKFYYMCGLPFETDEDVINIANEAFMALQVGLKYKKAIKINVSVSSLVPKPFTPFQWEPQMTIEETERKHNLVKSHLKDKRLQFKHHNARQSYLEGLFARGDRKLSQVLYKAFQNGCRFDEWSEHFDYSKWEQTFAETGVDLNFYLHRQRHKDEVLPWDHLFSQMKKQWLWNEFEAAQKEAFVEDCSIDKCAQFCGACDFKEVKNKIFVIDDKELAVKKGNREWYGRFGSSETNSESAPRASLNIFHLPPLHSHSEWSPGTPDPQMKNIQTGPWSLAMARTKTLGSGFRKKIRVKYAKKGLAALTGHLEFVTILKRAILRCGVEPAYTEGFHPQMKLSMGAPLALGIESDFEFFDLVILQPIEINDFISKMNQSMPQGVQILDAKFVDLYESSIYSDTTRFDYEVVFPKTISRETLKIFNQNLEDFKQGKDLFFNRERPRKKTKTLNLKDFLNLAPHSEFSNSPSQNVFRFSTKIDENGSIKPTEVIEVLTNLQTHELVDFKVKKVGIGLRQSF